MAKIETLNSVSQLSTILSKNAVVIIDFHATWCGPCKAIAPTFESLANKHAVPGKVAFTKCDVDQAQDIASQYGVRAMPTFLIFKNRAEAARVQGADVRGLTSAVEKYATEAKSAAATFATSGKGYTLGSAPTTAGSVAPAGQGRYVRNGQIIDNLPVGAQLKSFLNAVLVFAGLYFMSLFSLDPTVAAENSPFNITAGPGGVGPSVHGVTGGPGRMAPGAGATAGRRLGTLDSIRGGG